MDILKCLDQKTEAITLQLYEAAVMQIILKGLLYPQQYKKELNFWRIIMNILKKMVKMNEYEE
jgi:hypothetical protein